MLPIGPGPTWNWCYINIGPINNNECDLCDKNIPQSDIHLLDCSFMIEMCKELYSDTSIEYEDIFGDSDKQLEVVKMYIRIFDIKKTKEEEAKNISDDICRVKFGKWEL